MEKYKKIAQGCKKSVKKENKETKTQKKRKEKETTKEKTRKQENTKEKENITKIEITEIIQDRQGKK